MQILIVEDDDAKRDRLEGFLQLQFGGVYLRFAKSVNSAIDRLLEKVPDAVLLDMSLPTYDIGPGERGGRPQGFGGMEVLGAMDRYDLCTPVVIVTQYEAFSHEGTDVNHDDLSMRLEEEFPTNYFGLIYFNTIFGDWEEHLTDMLNGILKLGTNKP